MFDISLGPQEALPGLRGSPRVGHQLQSGRSFLQSASPAEMSFLPPSPGDRRCSTGVKMKVGATFGTVVNQGCRKFVTVPIE